jgi:hypothetical protein
MSFASVVEKRKKIIDESECKHEKRRKNLRHLLLLKMYLRQGGADGKWIQTYA